MLKKKLGGQICPPGDAGDSVKSDDSGESGDFGDSVETCGTGDSSEYGYSDKSAYSGKSYLILVTCTTGVVCIKKFCAV